MIQILTSIYPYFIFLSVFIVVLAIILFLVTRKYKDKRTKFYSLFLNLNARSVILVATTLLNLTFILYLTLCVKYYDDFILYLLIANSVVSIIMSLDIHLVGYDILYTVISVIILKVFSLIYNYLDTIYYNRVIFVLGIVFLLMIIIYAFFITIRKIEIIIKKNKFVRRLS